MSGHLVRTTASVIEVEPTEPDADGYRWKQFQATGHLKANCSCGLALAGPRATVAPLARAHART